MNHNEALQILAVEKYVLGELPQFGYSQATRLRERDQSTGSPSPNDYRERRYVGTRTPLAQQRVPLVWIGGIKVGKASFKWAS